MARVGVSITKTVSFRGVQQEFSNTYYYDVLDPLPTQSQAAALIDAVKAAEVPLHSTDVTFKFGRCWSAGGSAGTNQMIDQHNLTGNGTCGLVSAMDRERAFLLRLRAGVDTRGRPVYLRKYFHSCGAPGTMSITSGIMQQTAQISSGDKSTIQTLASALMTLTVSSKVYNITSKTGRVTSGGMECHNYLEHHQLGDMWRG